MTDTELINGLHDWHTYLGSYDKGPLIEQSAARLDQLAAENVRLTELVRRKDEALKDIYDHECCCRCEDTAKQALALTEPKP